MDEVLRAVGRLRERGVGEERPQALAHSLDGELARDGIEAGGVAEGDVPGATGLGGEGEPEEERMRGVARGGERADGEAAGAPQRLDKRVQLRLGRNVRVVDRPEFGSRDFLRTVGLGKALDEASELQLAEEREDFLAVVVFDLAGVEVETHLEVGLDRDERLAVERLFLLPFELAPDGLRLDLVEVLEELLDRAELADQVRRRLVAHALDARDVVAGVAAQRLEVGHERRREAPAFGGVRLVVDDGVTLIGPEHEQVQVRPDELNEVGVERDDPGLQPLGGRACRDRPGDVVGFETRHLVDRDREGIEHLAHACHLGEEVVRGLPARGLVVLAGFVPEGLAGRVPGGADVRGPELIDHAQERLGVAVRRERELALATHHRIGLRAQREEGAEEDAVRIEDDQARLRLGSGHGLDYRRERRRPRVPLPAPLYCPAPLRGAARMARPILHSPLCDLVGVEYPVVLAGMGPVAGGSVGPVATAELAAAVSNAGGLGVLGGSGHGPERLREEIAKLRSLTDKPFGVDLLLPANYMGPAATAKPPADPRELVPAEVTDGLKRMLADLGVPWVEAPPVPTATRPALRGEGGGMSDAQMEVVIEEKVPVFASGLGSPAHWLDRLHANSTVVFSLVGNVKNAKRMAAAGPRGGQQSDRAHVHRESAQRAQELAQLALRQPPRSRGPHPHPPQHVSSEEFSVQRRKPRPL